MERVLFLLFILCSLFVALPMPAAAESQTWKVRPSDNLDIIATTLEIPKEEIKKHNPGVLESSLQIGQQLKLPLRSYVESKTLEEELGKKDARIGMLERKSSDLEKKIASAESQLAWHPIWLWGFWISFGIIAFIVSGAYWIFRQTHPRVFEQPQDRSVRDLRESQIRARSSFPYDEEGASSRRGQWQPSLKRVPSVGNQCKFPEILRQARPGGAGHHEPGIHSLQYPRITGVVGRQETLRGEKRLSEI